MLGAPCPVSPGPERANCPWLRLLLHPGRNGRMTVGPGSHPIGIAELHLSIVDGHPGIANRLTNAVLPGVDLLVGVRVGTEQKVMATALEGGPTMA